jgi:ribosome biogenesis GTPase A
MGGSLGKKKSKIIIVGLDNSGKSTMINLLKPKKVMIYASLMYSVC